MKDSSISEGLDEAWIDRMTLVLISPPEFALPHPMPVPVNEVLSFDLAAVFNTSSISVQKLPPNLNFRSGQHLVGSVTNLTSFESTATNKFGETTRTLDIEPFGSNDTFALALDKPTLSFRCIPPIRWFTQANKVKTGSTALQSGAIGNNQQTEFKTYIWGPGKIKFDWRASTEEFLDFALFLVDGIPKEGIFVETTWTEVEADLINGFPRSQMDLLQGRQHHRWRRRDLCR
ncbi:MAG: hypothetical protein AAGC74_01230 [Verrucomicrobiota bacterium]